MELELEKPDTGSNEISAGNSADTTTRVSKKLKKPASDIPRKINTSGELNPPAGGDVASTPDQPGPVKRKGPLSRLFRIVRVNLFSSLTRRIMFLNLAALAVLLSSILYLNQFREGLIDARIESLLTQGRIIAGAIAASATVGPDAVTIDPEKLLELQAGESTLPTIDSFDSLNYPINPEVIAPALRFLIKPTRTRARIYDPEGLLVLDSRHLYTGGQILRNNLPSLGGKDDTGWIDRIGNALNRVLQRRDLPEYQELDGAGTQYPEVASALIGAPKPVVRMTKEGELTVSVAVPIQRFRAVLGVLLLSTEGDDIDRIVTEERVAIMRVFLVAGIVTFVLSILLASTIANPLRRLSEAAIRVKRGVKSRIEIPDFSARQDEIGDLSTSFGDMTKSLYQRIEAIESFAADVSHELKNPLTSLRSAVETLPLAKNQASRDRLMEVIQHDVRRLDRLITDISDASRLDAELVRDIAEKVDMAVLLQNVVEASRDVGSRNRNIKFNLEIVRHGAGKRGFNVAGHDTRLGQVINNLIDNARSFVPENTGQVDIELRREGDTIHMVVEDNGRGIQADHIDRIFERFYTDRSDTDGFGQNSGLGLSISRQIIEAHGGTIHAENRTGKITGARFLVALPADDTK